MTRYFYLIAAVLMILNGTWDALHFQNAFWVGYQIFFSVFFLYEFFKPSPMEREMTTVGKDLISRQLMFLIADLLSKDSQDYEEFTFDERFYMAASIALASRDKDVQDYFNHCKENPWGKKST